MPEKDNNEVQIEGTQFYRKSRASVIWKTAVLAALGFVLLAVLFAWAVADAGARQAYKEARDIRKALRAVGTEYFGAEESIYDPLSPTGLKDGAAQKIEEISSRSGQVYLYAWDNGVNAPLQFEYRKGLYRVIYTDSGYEGRTAAGTQGEFTVYYSLQMLNYEAE